MIQLCAPFKVHVPVCMLNFKHCGSVIWLFYSHHTHTLLCYPFYIKLIGYFEKCIEIWLLSIYKYLYIFWRRGETEFVEFWWVLMHIDIHNNFSVKFKLSITMLLFHHKKIPIKMCNKIYEFEVQICKSMQMYSNYMWHIWSMMTNFRVF